uniref:Tryptophan synthase beta chain n=1 Tax=Anthurium amnicola TaxID=1678845 RepID=A0A1D1Z1L1_9ARAE
MTRNAHLFSLPKHYLHITSVVGRFIITTVIVRLNDVEEHYLRAVRPILRPWDLAELGGQEMNICMAIRHPATHGSAETVRRWIMVPETVQENGEDGRKNEKSYWLNMERVMKADDSDGNAFALF